jgi:hypothetical protein
VRFPYLTVQRWPGAARGVDPGAAGNGTGPGPVAGPGTGLGAEPDVDGIGRGPSADVFVGIGPPEEGTGRSAGLAATDCSVAAGDGSVVASARRATLDGAPTPAIVFPDPSKVISSPFSPDFTKKS